MINIRSLFFLLVLFGLKLSAQEKAKINFKDSCIMTGGVMTISDFKKVCKICPQGAKKVISYYISYNEGIMDVVLPLKNNRFKFSDVKKPGLGTMILIDNIKGTDASGKTVFLKTMTIGLK